MADMEGTTTATSRGRFVPGLEYRYPHTDSRHRLMAWFFGGDCDA